MCKDCFENEIQSFPSQKDYEDFDFILTKKIGNDKTIKQGRFVTTAYKDIGYQVYECLKCGQLWALHDPDQADRGYFKKLGPSILGIQTNPSNIKQNYNRLIFVIIIIGILLTLFWLRN